MFRYSIVILVVVTAFSCSPHIESVQTRGEIEQLPVREVRPVVQERVQFKNVDVPLQQGPWYLVGETGFKKPIPGFPQRQITHASVTDNVVDRVVTVWHQTRLGAGHFAPYSPCHDETNIHAVVYSNRRDVNYCWYVHAVNLGTGGDPPEMNIALSEFAEKRGVFLSPTMLGVRFVSTYQRSRFYIDYMWSTDLLYPRPSNGVWLPDDWSRQAVATDPLKKAVASGLIEWGAHWEAAALSFRTKYQKFADDL